MLHISISNEESGIILDPSKVSVINGRVSIQKCEELECYIYDQPEVTTLFIGDYHFKISNFKEEEEAFSFTAN